MANTTKPGASTPQSGQYIEVNPKGRPVGKGEITSVVGKPMPPTSTPGSSWLLVDPTVHVRR